MLTGIPDRNNTNYPLALSHVLSGIQHSKGNILQHHQKVIKSFMVEDSRNRGLVIFNEPGTGKTITAASIALEFRETRDVLILAAKSLHSNFKSDLIKYVQLDDPSTSTASINSMMDAQFNFVSLNASNMITQVKQSGKTKEEIAYDKHIGQFAELADLEKKLLIVDEAHNLFNSIVAGGDNAFKLYTAIMATKDIKILFLTGTPIVNDPFELVAAYNMCAGWEILPTEYDQFHSMFVDRKNTTVRNYDKFVNRIYGLTSYYGSWYQTGGVVKHDEAIKRKDFPDQLPMIVEMIPMSSHQYSVYKAARQREQDVTSQFSKGPKKVESMRKPKSDGASYRVHSRQACNYAAPDSIRNKNGSVDYGKLESAHLENLDVYSPKMKRLIELIISKPKRTHVVYSSFVGGAGLNVIAKALKHNGFGEYETKDPSNSGVFAIFSGDTTPIQRKYITDQFSMPNNRFGSNIRVLLLSGAGAEGISLKNTGYFYAFDPFWNWGRILQSIARTVRYKGHIDFKDPADRTLQPILLLSDYPNDIDRLEVVEPTTDIQLYTKSLANYKLNTRFFAALIASSFDCQIHIKNASEYAKSRIKCVQCAPTNKPLFYKDIDKDLAAPNPCIASRKKEVNATEMVLNGKKYYWSKDNDGLSDIFEFKKSLNGFVPMDPGHIEYGKLIQHVVDLNSK